MSDFKRAMRDPSWVYQYPKDVVADESLTLEQKTQILNQWECDAQQILTADEENMAGDSDSMLQRVRHALAELGA